VQERKKIEQQKAKNLDLLTELLAVLVHSWWWRAGLLSRFERKGRQRLYKCLGKRRGNLFVSILPICFANRKGKPLEHNTQHKWGRRALGVSIRAGFSR